MVSPRAVAHEAGQRNPRGRPRKYSDELLVEAALRVMDREGYAALTIRSLAAELGTSHTTLYNYIGSIEEIEDKAVHRLTDQLPMPKAVSVPQLRVELIAFLVASRGLMLQHPGVLLSRPDSAATRTFLQVGDRWQEVLLAYAPDRKTVHLAMGALLSTVLLAVEGERRLGAEYEKRPRSIPGRPARDPVEQYDFEQYLDAMVDLVLPGLTAAKHGKKS